MHPTGTIPYHRPKWVLEVPVKCGSPRCGIARNFVTPYGRSPGRGGARRSTAVWLIPNWLFLSMILRDLVIDAADCSLSVLIRARGRIPVDLMRDIADSTT